MKQLKTFSYCLKSGRKRYLDDYYKLVEVSGNVYKFHVYDANMFPSNDFSEWNPKSIKEVVDYIKRTFDIENKVIMIDSFELKLEDWSDKK